MDNHTITEDRLLDGRVRLLQPATGYRVALDTLVLAASVEAEAGEAILDVGAGVGAAALCLAVRVPGTRIVGIEMQRELVSLGTRNVQLNALQDRVEMIVADVAQRPPPRLAAGTFNHVMTNPPHMRAQEVTAPPDAVKAAANVESTASLAAWLAYSLLMLRPKGSLTVVHRADRLADILACLNGKAGEIVVYPLWPAEGRPARRVLVRARKSVATPLRLAPGLVLHEDGGAFTAQAEDILRHAAPLYL
ncbi:MAG: tRNA1(Val) (adenine(37)-N6)-methyltransferase [Reyranellaceae bacterium]